MGVVGIHHVQPNVRDLGEAVSFYIDRLGFAKADMPDFDAPVAWLQAGDHQLHLIKGVTPENHEQHVALEVDDLDTCIRKLRDGGIEVGNVMVFGPRRQAVLFDPSGNKIEINELVSVPSPKVAS
jgi:catechol 2,3-dioxygenase-like lactoylglutathione lyase family enzyme